MLARENGQDSKAEAFEEWLAKRDEVCISLLFRPVLADHDRLGKMLSLNHMRAQRPTQTRIQIFAITSLQKPG
jgi:hypothetical protein